MEVAPVKGRVVRQAGTAKGLGRGAVAAASNPRLPSQVAMSVLKYCKGALGGSGAGLWPGQVRRW